MMSDSNDLPLLPLGRAIAADIKTIREPGLLFPVRERDGLLLMIDVGGQWHGFVLSGQHAFVHFPVVAQSSHKGLFVPDIEVVIDYASGTSDSRYTERLGALVLRENELCVVASRAGNSYFDAAPLPLWTKVHGGSGSASLAFKKWGLALRDGERLRPLWQHDLDSSK